jgi:hypothetical protein
MEVVLQALVSYLGSPHHVAAVLAYIDPSTGSLIFQVVAAAAISAGLFVRGLRERFLWLVTGGWRARKTDGGTIAGNDSAEAAKDAPAAESRRKAA